MAYKFRLSTASYLVFSSPVTAIAPKMSSVSAQACLCTVLCTCLVLTSFSSPVLLCRPDINKRLGGVLAIDELIDVKVSLGWQQQRETTRQGL